MIISTYLTVCYELSIPINYEQTMNDMLKHSESF